MFSVCLSKTEGQVQNDNTIIIYTYIPYYTQRDLKAENYLNLIGYEVI